MPTLFVIFVATLVAFVILMFVLSAKGLLHRKSNETSIPNANTQAPEKKQADVEQVHGSFAAGTAIVNPISTETNAGEREIKVEPVKGGDHPSYVHADLPSKETLTSAGPSSKDAVIQRVGSRRPNRLTLSNVEDTWTYEEVEGASWRTKT